MLHGERSQKADPPSGCGAPLPSEAVPRYPNMSDSPRFETSDKFTWHRYTQFYEPFLARLGAAKRILEFGVFHGASVRYLHDRYPSAEIVGCDILPIQADWPVSDRIRYVTLDQGNNQELDQLFVEHPGPFDLIIEDGSHQPEHQRNCLVASVSHLRDGGVYILEDLHTSHPDHSHHAPAESETDERLPRRPRPRTPTGS